MPLPRFEKLEPDRQQTILAAARAEFSAHGFANASYNTIIKAAGLSKGAMYYYFADKADLCRTVIERVVVQLTHAIGELGPFDDARSYWAQIRAYAERAALEMLAMPELADLTRLIYGEGSSSEVLGPLIERGEAWCTELLAAGQRVDAVRSDIPLSFLATAVIGVLVHTDRWIAQNLETLEPAEFERLSLACLDMVEHLARPSAASPA
ncbi:Transcriptional regulator, TetR family protein [Enhygromyxa salina]|uniref:Transcriptional regulator, TetR family protein n=1 Tax=Enhygromyxa salina TaxID=215803 RepID=A0A0C2CTU2_9BACT|nr:TetR/AcrR family transcriptional regulator [Enhygromyxa salina]KIG13040.1 Transcriptional regulator, TetR family protein [Enhygromyxa salina]